jgi:hypothetical protein
MGRHAKTCMHTCIYFYAEPSALIMLGWRLYTTGLLRKRREHVIAVDTGEAGISGVF